MREADLRACAVDICRRAAAAGCMAGQDGNLSVRLDQERLLITPSGRAKGGLEPQDLLVVDMAGRVLEGRGRPSVEMALHLMVYARRPDAGAAVHAHPPAATAFACAGRELDTAALPELLYLLGRVPTAPYATLGTPELARAVEPLLAEHDAMLLAHHGSLTLGPDLATAWARTEKLEHAAQILIMARALGGARPLPPAEQRRLTALGRQARAGQAPTPDSAPSSVPPPPLEERFQRKLLPLTAAFAVEKRHADARGEAHLIVDDLPLRRVCLLTLNVGAGYRGGHVHGRKHEGFYIVSGKARCEMACPVTGQRLTLDLGPGERLWIEPGVAHRFLALEPLTFVEFTDQPYDPDDDRPFAF